MLLIFPPLWRRLSSHRVERFPNSVVGRLCVVMQCLSNPIVKSSHLKQRGGCFIHQSLSRQIMFKAISSGPYAVIKQVRDRFPLVPTKSTGGIVDVLQFPRIHSCTDHSVASILRMQRLEWSGEAFLIFRLDVVSFIREYRRLRHRCF